MADEVILCIAQAEGVAFGRIADELVFAHQLADGAHEVDALVEGDVVPLMVLAVLAAAGEAAAVHRAAVFHLFDAHAGDEALRPADALDVYFHLAVCKVAVQIVAVEGVGTADEQGAVFELAAHAAGEQLPVAHAVFEVVLVDELARGDVFDAHLAHFHRRGVRADEQAAGVVLIDGLHAVDDVFARVAGEHLLDVVVGGDHDVARVEPDEVGRPFVVGGGSEQGRVAGEPDDVAVALAAGQKRCFGDGGAQVVFAVEAAPAVAHGVHGVLAHEHLGARAVVAVVAAGIVDEPLIGVVDVLVDDGVAVFFVDDLPVVAGILGADIDARGGDDGDAELLDEVGLLARVFVLAQAHQAGGEVFKIHVAPVLVADADVFQLEGFGVAHVCAHLRPMRLFRLGRVDAALGEEQEVCHVVDDFLFEHLGAGHDAAVVFAALGADADLAEQAAVQHGQRRHVQVFAQAEVFVEADAVRLHIPPGVGDLMPLFQRAYRAPPAVLVFKRLVALDDAAAREAQEGGMAVFEHLHDAGRKLAVPVLFGIPPHVGRKQRHIVDADVAGALEDHHQAPQLRLQRLDRAGDLDPFAAVARKLDLRLGGQHRTGAADVHFHLAGKAELFYPHAEVVRLPFIQRHAVVVPRLDGVAGVFQAVDAAHMHHQVGRVAGRDAPFCGDVVRASAGDVPILVLHLADGDGHGSIVQVVREIGELERVVDDHLCVQAAVCRLVDVLKEQAVEVLADLDAAVVLIERILHHKKKTP